MDLSQEAARYSGLISLVHQDINSEDSDLPLPNITTGLLKRVVEWMEYHVLNPPWTVTHPLPSNVLSECGVCEFDEQFVDLSDNELSDLITAAGYLDIQPLSDLACAKVMCMMRSLPLDECRKRFNPRWKEEDEELSRQLAEDERWEKELIERWERELLDREHPFDK